MEESWAIFRNGKLWTDCLETEEECLKELEIDKEFDPGDYTYKLITEEERQSYYENYGY